MTSSNNTFTYWSLLGLSPGSDAEKLRKAFIREAKIWHPDLNTNNKNAEERFKLINEAYLVLSDPRKKFEWELAGRPSFEIESLEDQIKENIPNSKANNTVNTATNFTHGEKILILIITSLLMLFLNYHFL